jgi:hypothetical protein
MYSVPLGGFASKPPGDSPEPRPSNLRRDLETLGVTTRFGRQALIMDESAPKRHARLKKAT